MEKVEIKTENTTAQKVPPEEVYDVAVCGGGPAGFVAAVAAARNNRKTILIERNGFLGGMATAAMVSPISGFNKKGKRVIGGIPAEFINILEKYGGAVTDYPSGNIPFDPEIYKLAAQRAVLEAGAALLLHSYVSDCVVESNRITGIMIENKSGRRILKAKYFIDCTGDADLAKFAGLPFRIGEGLKKELQPMTLWFRLGGVDTGNLENMEMRLENTRYYNKRISDTLKAMTSEKKVPKFGGPWMLTTLRQGEVSVNMTRYAGDGTDAIGLTEAECTLREDVFKLVELLKDNFPEFKNCYILDTGTQVGIRETRRIDGLYEMTADDILRPGKFPDTIAKGAHPIDIHRANSTDQNVKFVEEAYNIPYRSLIPKESENLIVAGRCISASREAIASIRVQATCMALGQAAGTAAALCCKKNLPVYALNGSELSRILDEQGAII